MNFETLGKFVKEAADAARGTDGAGVVVGVILGAAATLAGVKASQQDSARKDDNKSKVNR